MIITIGEAIQRVQSLYSKGNQSFDSRLSSRHIYSVLQTARSKVLEQKHNKGQFISQWLYQTLSCMELIKAAPYECPCIPANGCIILRSKFKIPKPITGIGNHLIQSITSLDSNIVFNPSTFETEKYNAKGNKFTGNRASYYIRNEYIYITVLKELKVLTMTALFDDPVEAIQFPSMCPCEGCDCINIMDSSFPTDRATFSTMLDFVYNELVIMFPQMKEDRSDNARDDSSGGMVHTNQQQQ